MGYGHRIRMNLSKQFLEAYIFISPKMPFAYQYFEREVFFFSFFWTIERSVLLKIEVAMVKRYICLFHYSILFFF